MGDSKKFYWIKLRTDFFQEDSPIDFLMSQDNGAEYVVLYQMLCLKTANMNGQLSSQIGEVIIPYDIKKIVRDTKYFDVDTVTIALELFKKIGLIYEQADGNLMIANYSKMIGSESANKEAQKKRDYRHRLAEKQRITVLSEDTKEDVTEDTPMDNVVDIDKDIEVDKMSDRDKRLDIRDKDINNINISNSKELDCPNESDKNKFVFQAETELWNSLKAYGINPIRGIVSNSKRAKLLHARFGQYGNNSFSEIIQEIKDSDFLQGRHSGKPWQVTFDWVILPNNYPKVLEWNYRNKDIERSSNNIVSSEPDNSQEDMSFSEWEEYVMSEEWNK